MLTNQLNSKVSDMVRWMWPFISSVIPLISLVCFAIFGAIFSLWMPGKPVVLPLIPAFILAVIIGFLIESNLERRLFRKYSGRTLLTINLSSEANDVLEELAKRSGGDKVDVLRKSLGLMELAMQAHEQGLAVGATKQPEALETEFTGFEANLDGRIA